MNSFMIDTDGYTKINKKLLNLKEIWNEHK